MDTYVPQELIDHIVDFLYNDPQTLWAARLISRSWNISARVHFFRELNLLIPRTLLIPPATTSEDRGVYKFTRLLDILNTSPDMAYFVREVIIGNTTGMTMVKWTIYDPLLSSIVTQLKRVTTICVREVDWSQLSPLFSNLLTEFFKSPQLRHLDMWNCRVPSMPVLLGFLNSSCTLTGLRLSHIRFSHDVDAAKTLLPTLGVINETNTTMKKPLQRLYIETVPLAPLLHALLTNTTPCSIDVTKLHSLFLDHIDDIPSVRHFLQVAGGSLESLEMWASICQSRYSSPAQDTIDLSHSPRLKYVQVSGLHWTSNMCPAECLYPFFQNINTPHSLQSLDIVITARKRKTDQFNFIQWNSFDQVLSRPVFPALQKVQIMVYSPFVCFSPSDADQLIKALPRLEASRKVHVMCM